MRRHRDSYPQPKAGRFLQFLFQATIGSRSTTPRQRRTFAAWQPLEASTWFWQERIRRRRRSIRR